MSESTEKKARKQAEVEAKAKGFVELTQGELNGFMVLNQAVGQTQAALGQAIEARDSMMELLGDKYKATWVKEQGRFILNTHIPKEKPEPKVKKVAKPKTGDKS